MESNGHPASIYIYVYNIRATRALVPHTYNIQIKDRRRFTDNDKYSKGARIYID